jgi:hypothetical protein
MLSTFGRRPFRHKFSGQVEGRRSGGRLRVERLRELVVIMARLRLVFGLLASICLVILVRVHLRRLPVTWRILLLRHLLEVGLRFEFLRRLKVELWRILPMRRAFVRRLVNQKHVVF